MLSRFISIHLIFIKKKMKDTRRKFLKKAGTGFLALGFSSSILKNDIFRDQVGKPEKKAELFKIGVAGYTFRKLGIDAALEMMARVNVKYLCIKNFHLPFNSTSEQIAEFHSKLKAKGITGYAVGPISMNTEESADQAFDYAKRVGVTLISGNSKILPYIEKKVKEYDFRFAIHNEGPTLEMIYSQIKDLDSRIGFCHDIVYSMQASGIDPATLTLKYGSRIYDVHIKDVTEGTKEKKGKECELGRGVIDFASLIKALRKIKYNGVCSLEFEKDADDPLAGIAESIGYFKGVLDTI
jgi:inosose dehydratase